MTELLIETEENESGLTITHAVCEGTVAVIPESVDGKPITAIGRHGFATGNEKLERVSFPRSLTAIGDFAFLGCKSLKHISFYDGIRNIGGALFANSGELCSFDVTRVSEEQGPMLASISSDISFELDVTIHELDGSVARILFPEFFEISDERVGSLDVPFNYEIGGAGYTYHHCFKRRQLSYKTYDKLWPDFLRRDYDPVSAVKLAWYRLSYPVQLGDIFRDNYTDFIRKNASLALSWMTDQRDADAVSRLLKTVEIDDADVYVALERARQLGLTDMTAVLLERLRGSARAAEKTFDL